MAIATLQTLGILKSAKIAKDATGGPGGGAVTTTDLQAGGLLQPEQGGRTARLDMQKRKLRKPVLLGKSCSELTVEKAKDALGHGSEKRDENSLRPRKGFDASYALKFHAESPKAADSYARQYGLVSHQEGSTVSFKKDPFAGLGTVVH